MPILPHYTGERALTIQGDAVKLNIRLKTVILGGLGLLVCAVISLPIALAAKNDTVEFADANLMRVLTDAGADTNGDGGLTEYELAVLTGVLDLSGKGISDITGLSFATGLAGLNLSGNAVRDISEISALTNLTDLDLSGNMIGDITALNALTGLKTLDLSGNMIYEIDALYNTEAPPETVSLTALDVSDNYLNAADGSADRAVTDALMQAGCAVTFDPQKPIPASGVALNAEELDMCTGDTATLTAAVLPEDAADRVVSWQSSQPAVAAVKDGVVTAHAVGTVTITVTAQDGGWTAACKINVKENALSSEVYVAEGGLLRVPALTMVEPFKASFKNNANDVRVLDADGNEVALTTVGTGMTAKLVVGGIERDVRAIVVQGDVNGDGVVSIKDYTLVNLHLKAHKTLGGVYAVAADYDRDSTVTEADGASMQLALSGLRGGGDGLIDLPEVADPRIRAFLDAALAQLGKPYVWGAEGPDTFDCSGFVHHSLKQAGYDVERLTADMYSRLKDWAYVDKDELQPGDLMFYYTDAKNDGDHVGHIGIYLGNGYHIHASSDYNCVIICGVQGWYKDALAFGRRVFQ